MDLADVARKIMADAAVEDCEIVLPVDAVVAQKFAAGAPSRVVPVDEVGDEDMILDIGPTSAARVETLIEKARTLVWNGPFGAFEISPFDAGTNAIAKVAGAFHQVRPARKHRWRRRHDRGAEQVGRGQGFYLYFDGGRCLP